MVSKDGIIRIDTNANAAVPIATALATQWHLLKAEKEQLDKHYLLKWTGDYFRGKLRQAPLQEKWHIEHDQVFYVVKYLSTLRQSPCNYAPFVFLSFRRLKGKNIGIILVRAYWNASIGKRKAQAENQNGN